MNKINLDLIKTIISNHIKIETKKIDINSKSSDFAQWDSLAQVNIILDIEKNTKKKIAASKIGDLTSVKSIIDYLNNN
jgi:acyl carrier protein